MSAGRSWTSRARAFLVEALEAAADRFPPPGGDEVERIHEARRALKRAAAIARLFAPIVGGSAYDAIEAVDKARRQVGRARDLDVLPDVLSGLKCLSATREALMRAIAEERALARSDYASMDVALLRAELRAAAKVVADWDLGDEDDDRLCLAMRQSYRAAKRRGRAAWASGDADDLHSFRARVVDLGQQWTLFESAWPALFEAVGEEWRRLRQTLGAHNDLTVLGEFALARRDLPAEAAKDLAALVLKKRRPLERRAKRQFARLFAERPGAFARRLSAYLAHPQRKSRTSVRGNEP